MRFYAPVENFATRHAIRFGHFVNTLQGFRIQPPSNRFRERPSQCLATFHGYRIARCNTISTRLKNLHFNRLRNFAEKTEFFSRHSVADCLQNAASRNASNKTIQTENPGRLSARMFPPYSETACEN